MGIGDWELGIGDSAQSPIPNPQSPIPNPPFCPFFNFIKNIFIKIKKNNNKFFFEIKKWNSNKRQIQIKNQW